VRRALAWLVAVPLVLGGAQLAHAADYWLIAPDPHERAELIAGTGHGYFSYLPFAVALFGALLAAALIAVSWDARRGGHGVALDRWPLALLPVVTFVLQEHLERHLHDGSFPWHAVTETTFLLGLVLQIPFAIAAYAVVRLLLRVAEAIGFSAARRRTAWRVTFTAAAPLRVDLPTRSRLASGSPTRGPPRLTPA
jgi:hypothetical protein